ncbi:hypothetical protein ACW23B_09630 [Streptomyces albidoflavus]
MSTRGGYPFQEQKTEELRSPWVKVTRIQAPPLSSRVQTCMVQPGVGVAETNSAESVPMSRTTWPPATV